MTTRPELSTDSNLVPGLAAVAFFVVVAVAMMTATYGEAVGYDDGADITASIGNALFNFTGGSATVEGAGFLSVFFIITLVLIASLVAAILLARREGETVLDLKRGGEQ